MNIIEKLRLDIEQREVESRNNARSIARIHMASFILIVLGPLILVLTAIVLASSKLET